MWPIPQYFEILGFNTIGYVDDVIFPLKINIRDISKKTIINLDISYLTCKDICIPGKAQLRLLIPPGIGQFTSHNYNLQKELSLIPKSNFKFADFSSHKDLLELARINAKDIVKENIITNKEIEYLLHIFQKKMALSIAKF